MTVFLFLCNIIFFFEAGYFFLHNVDKKERNNHSVTKSESKTRVKIREVGKKGMCEPSPSSHFMHLVQWLRLEASFVNIACCDVLRDPYSWRILTVELVGLVQPDMRRRNSVSISLVQQSLA